MQKRRGVVLATHPYQWRRCLPSTLFVKCTACSFAAEAKITVLYSTKKRRGAAPPHRFITEIWFESPEVLKAVTATAKWKAIAGDVANFAAPGGSTAFVSVVEPKH